jgi:nicotinic acid mononucleotide adenylyltransferase
VFFVMGADSWADILTWREWEKGSSHDEPYCRHAARI